MLTSYFLNCNMRACQTWTTPMYFWWCDLMCKVWGVRSTVINYSFILLYCCCDKSSNHWAEILKQLEKPVIYSSERTKFSIHTNVFTYLVRTEI
jgi:hypothetical protein